MTRRPDAAFLRLLVLILVTAASACSSEAPAMTELQRVKLGALEVLLLSDHEAIRHGKDAFIVEFRSASGEDLVDVGQIRATATMPMPGMAMFGSINLERTETPGRYSAISDFGMAGTWRVKLEWDGVNGSGAVTFSGTVQ